MWLGPMEFPQGLGILDKWQFESEDADWEMDTELMRWGSEE